MCSFIKSVLSFLLFSFTSMFANNELVYIPFDVAMQADKYEEAITSDRTEQEVEIKSEDLINLFKDLYEKNSFKKITPSENLKIPKIVHQIWIGKAVPEKFKLFQESWKKYHPDWEYKLWIYQDVDDFHFYNEDLIKESRNPGEISDIMRYEILYRFGGLYVDFDFECLRPHDELHKMYDFYIGIQPLDTEFVQLGIGLIGSIPGHPILRHAIVSMRSSWNHLDYEHNPPKRTGPIFFTKSFFASAGKEGTVDIAFPVDYFYPLGCKEFLFDYEKWEAQGSFGIHHWASSWMKPEFRRPRFQSLD